MSKTKTLKKATPKATVKKATKPAKGAKAKPVAEGKKLSAIDSAAKVLAENKGEPMNTKGMIEAMATKRYWTSPGGKTPSATLYSAILTEINKKRKDSRFVKTDRGLFTLKK